MVTPVVVALGEAMVEFNQTTPGQADFRQGFGGDTSNAAIACARQGIPSAYLTRLGNDAFGAMLLNLWQAESVGTQGVQTDAQAHTAVYFVTHDASGHAFSYLRKGSAASRMTPAFLQPDLIRQARFLHRLECFRPFAFFCMRHPRSHRLAGALHLGGIRHAGKGTGVE